MKNPMLQHLQVSMFGQGIRQFLIRFPGNNRQGSRDIPPGKDVQQLIQERMHLGGIIITPPQGGLLAIEVPPVEFFQQGIEGFHGRIL